MTLAHEVPRDEHSKKDPRPLGTSTPRPLLVSPSRHIFQRLTNEIPRNFPCSFGHVPVVFHLAHFHEKPPKTRSAPTHALHKCWHDFQEPCVTLCHLRFCSTCARSTPLFSPSAPRPLVPSAPFSRLLSPWICRRPKRRFSPTARGAAAAGRPMTIMPDPHGQGPEPGQLGKD